MAIRGRATVKNPYGDDKGFGNPSGRRRGVATSAARATHNAKTKHYVRLLMDDCGNLQTESSSSLGPYAPQIFSGEVVERFREACRRIEAGAGLDTPLGKPKTAEIATATPKKTSKKRRKVEEEVTEACEDPERTPEVFPRSGKPMSIRIGDRDAVIHYYATCLRAFQQINCRLICKLWIKLIHPKKQVTNPYNGTIKTADGGSIKDPDKTKPLWWAPTVRHKEPDHLKKDERIELMVHLIDQCVKDDNHFEQQITVEQLFDEVSKKKTELNGGPGNDQLGRLKLIRDICDLRIEQQRWEEECIDDDAIVEVESHEEHAKKAEREEAMREAKIAAERKTKDTKLPITFEALELRDEAPSVLTPTSSATSPNLFQQSGVGIERDPHRRISQTQTIVDPYSPQSMNSYHSMTASPFHDIHAMSQQALVFSQQPAFHPTGLEQPPEQMAAMSNGPFGSMSRTDSFASWNQVSNPQNAFVNQLGSFADQSTGESPMHGLQLDQMVYHPQHYAGHSQDETTTMSSFQAMNPLDPRQLAFEPWKYRNIP